MGMQIRGDGTYWPQAGGAGAGEPGPGSAGASAVRPSAQVGAPPSGSWRPERPEQPEPVAGVWRSALPAVDASVPQARHMVRDLLFAQGLGAAPYDDLRHALLLIISELVTNAVRHAAVLSPQIVVEVVIGSGWVRVSVEDAHPYRPSALQNDFGRTGGRGLLLVRAMVLEYGGGCDVERTVGGGKVVWASLPVRPRPVTSW